MKRQIISFELDEKLSSKEEDEIIKILEEAKAENIEFKFLKDAIKTNKIYYYGSYVFLVIGLISTFFTDNIIPIALCVIISLFLYSWMYLSAITTILGVILIKLDRKKRKRR